MLALGVDPTNALVISQVVLSFGIPFALIPLRVARPQAPDVMGPMANPNWLTAIAAVLAGLIIALNVFLLEQVFFG